MTAIQLPPIHLKAFDHYNRYARILPAVIAAAPALTGLILLFTHYGISWSSGVASFGALGILWAMSDLARRLGKNVEPEIYKRLGGMPSIRMLRRNDETFDDPSKERYRAFLAKKLGIAAPTPAEERSDPKAADGFYDACSRWLRTHAGGDHKKFNILFNENVTYGFRRNMLGVRWPAAALNVLVSAICVTQLWPITWLLNMDDPLSRGMVIVLVVAVVHGLWLVFGVTWDAAEQAANAYGRQLISSTESFVSEAPKPKAPRNKKDGPAGQAAA